MSGKYNRSDDIVYRVLDKGQKSDIIFYVDENGELYNDVYCVVVKRGLSRESAIIEANRILKFGGFSEKIKSINIGRLDYDEFEGCWSFDDGGEVKSELVWIALT